MAVYSVTQQSFRVADTQMFGVHRTAGNGITMVKDTHPVFTTLVLKRPRERPSNKAFAEPR
jgi:hypothetical protein